MDRQSVGGESVLSPRLTDPAPVLAVGIIAWIVASVVVVFSGDRWAHALPTCLTGIVMGAVGFTLFLVQRAAARRGSKTAQRGLI
jgi:Flp pilus assembly protein TadB